MVQFVCRREKRARPLPLCCTDRRTRWAVRRSRTSVKLVVAHCIAFRKAVCPPRRVAAPSFRGMSRACIAYYCPTMVSPLQTQCDTSHVVCCSFAFPCLAERCLKVATSCRREQSAPQRAKIQTKGGLSRHYDIKLPLLTRSTRLSTDQLDPISKKRSCTRTKGPIQHNGQN